VARHGSPAPTEAVSPRNAASPAVLVIRFTRRIARQCAAKGSRLPDWVVCDAIANGSRQPTGRRGDLGGAVFRFEKAFPRQMRPKAPRGARLRTVAVLGEVTRDGCLALRLLVPGRQGKIRNEPGFLNRAGPK
jgi:hypothetical protein